jgi:hypothetical protein
MVGIYLIAITVVVLLLWETLVYIYPELRCILDEGHRPARHPLGGFRCVRCGKPGADLASFGVFLGSDNGDVKSHRRRYSDPPDEE